MNNTSSFANNFWGADDAGVAPVLQRMHDAKQTCEEIHAFFRERIAIEEDYARRMNMLAKRALGSNETGSLKEALEVVRATSDAVAHAHGESVQQMKKELSQLDSFAANMRQKRKGIESQVEKLHKTKTQQTLTAEKARAKFEMDCHKINGYSAQQNMLMGRELDKNNLKLEKVHMVLDASKRDYHTALRLLADTTHRWITEWKSSCDGFQDLEEERISFLKSHLWAYTNIVSSVCVKDDDGCEKIRVALEKCDVDADISNFIATKATGNNIPEAPVFIDYMSGVSGPTGPTYQRADFARDNSDDSNNAAMASAAASIAIPQSSSQLTMSDIASAQQQSVTGNSSPPEQRSSSRRSSIFGRASSTFSQLTAAPSDQSSSGPLSDPPALSTRSRSESQGALDEPERRTWSSPFRRRSRRWQSTSSISVNANGASTSSNNSFNSSNNSNNSGHSGQSAGTATNTTSNTSPRPVAPGGSHSRPHSVLSLGENLFDLGVTSSETSRSTSPVKKALPKDDPLLAALQRLKVASSDALQSPPPQQQQPSQLIPPNAAFTANEMNAAKNHYATQTSEMYGEDHRAPSPMSNFGHPQQPNSRRGSVDVRQMGGDSRSHSMESVRQQQSYNQPPARPRSQYYEPTYDHYEQQQQSYQQPTHRTSQQFYPDHRRSKSASPSKHDHYMSFSNYPPPQAVRSPSPGPQMMHHARSSSQLSHGSSQRSVSPNPAYRRSTSPNPYANPLRNTPPPPQPGRTPSPMRRPKYPTVSRDGRPVLRHSRAAYDYRAAIPEEVSFRKGDIMSVLRMQDDGWWEVEVLNSGRFGLAPSNFLIAA